MDLPKNEHSFQLSVVGERTGKKYEGKFTVKCLLSVQEMVEIGLRIDRYNGGSQTLPPGVARMNRSIAEMEVRKIKAPSWWTDSNDGRDLMDSNVITEVLLAALAAEDKYTESLKQSAEQAEASIEKAVSEKRAEG